MKQTVPACLETYTSKIAKWIATLALTFSATSLPACTQESPEKKFAGNTLQSGVGSLLSDSELPVAVERFEKGEIKFAWRLQTTYNAKKDEVEASVYARSLSVQENDPDAVAVQSFGLSQLEKSEAVCNAMRLNLQIWARWKDNKFHKYSDGERQYEQKCLR